MVDCPSEDLLAAFVSGNLQDELVAEVERHLADCTRCAGAVADAVSMAPAGAESRSPLEAGARIGRYEIIGLAGKGGVGLVYVAHDPSLDRKVALKVLRHGGDDLEQRLQREARAMARVHSPHVVGVHDVGAADGRLWVAMEYVEGPTLRRWLDERKRSVPEIIDAFVQAGRGLAAAHAAGIIHRDFKPDNVLIRPGGQAAVTDFGIALGASGLDGADGLPPAAEGMGGIHHGGPTEPHLTDTGVLVGTPAFMAPEQMRGERVDARADLFSFCVALYAALYGRHPFPTHDLRALSAAILAGEAAPPPRDPSVPAAVQEVVQAGLRPRPEDRPPTMDELLRRLTAAVGAAGRRAARWVAAAWVMAAAAIGGGMWWSTERASPHPAARSVAVLGLRDLGAGGESSWLSTALGELIAGELVAGGDLRRIPADGVARIARELGIGAGGPLPVDQLGRVRAHLDADLVVGGSYLAANGRLRLDLALQDTRSGETLATVLEEGTESALFDVVARAGGRLRSRLGRTDLSAAEQASARAALPADPVAARAYAEGLARLRLLDALGARERLEDATRRAPDFPLAHAALSEAFRSLGHSADEEREAQLAWQHAGSLAREQQLGVEARLRVARKEWPRAIEVYRALREFFPGTLDYALPLAGAQVDAGRARDALETLSQLRREAPEAAARDPRIDLLEAAACDVLADYPCQDRAAHAAAEKGRALGARELVGEALGAESNAALQVGDRARAARAADEAHRLFVAVGNRHNVGRALRARGRVAWKTGQLGAARGFFEEAVAIFRGLGDNENLARALSALAGLESDLAHPEAALRLYREAQPLFEKAADRVGLASSHINLGQQLRRARRLDEAERELLQGLALSRELGKRNFEAISLESLGALYLDRGEPARSVEMERQGQAVAAAIQDVTTVAQTGSKLAEALGALGEVALAEEEFAKAIAILERQNETGRLAGAKVRLGRLLLATGRLDEAETLARSAVLLHERTGVDTSDSPALLARLLAARGALPEARSMLARAQARGSDLDVEIAAAEIDLAEKRAGQAVERLTRALSTGLPQVPDRLEAQRVLSRAQLAAGQAREARKTAKTMADDARTRGFALLSRWTPHGDR